MATRERNDTPYLYDANGNVAQLIDDSDTSTDAHYEYKPFGGEIVASGTYAGDNKFRFSTKFWDEGSELRPVQLGCRCRSRNRAAARLSSR